MSAKQKKDPKKLREQAAKLLEEAKRIEQTEAVEIGKYIMVSGYTMETIKAVIKKDKEANTHE